MSAFNEVDLQSLTPVQRRYLDQREHLLQSALEDILLHARQVRHDLQSGGGIWLDSFGPLTPEERGLILREARKMLDLPQE